MRTIASFALCLLASPALAQLGSLTPPPGAVDETMKPLDVVEARTPVGPDTTPGDATSIYTISEPGSYYLTEDVLGEVGRNGIVIASPDVTLDLNGFSVQARERNVGIPINIESPRPRGSGGDLDPVEGTLTGILLPSFVENVNIRNGAVYGWERDGVAFLSDAGHISEVVAYANGRWGINCSGSFAGRVSDCRMYANGPDSAAPLRGIGSVDAGGGLLAGQAMIVTGCTAQACANGFFLDTTGAQLIDCVAVNCDGPGIRAGAQNVLIEGCSVTTTGQTPDELISVEAGAVRISECSVADNTFPGTATGIRVETGADIVIERCSIRMRSVAIAVSAVDVTLKDNTLSSASASTITGDADAIRLLIDSNVIDIASGQTAVSVVPNLDATAIRNVFRGSGFIFDIGIGNNFAPVLAPTATDGSPFSNIAY